MKNKSQYILIISVLVLSFISLTVIPLYYVMEMYPAFNSALIKDKEIAASQIASHLVKMVPSKAGMVDFNPDMVTKKFQKRVDEARRDFGLLKIKIFAPNRRVVYSTDKKDVGNLNTYQYFKEIVMKGGRFSKMVSKGEHTLENQKILRDVVETYMPIMADGQFRGAFELYYNVTEAKKFTQTTLANSRNILLLIFGVLLTILTFVSFKSLKAMRRQQETDRELIATNAELKLLFDLTKIMANLDNKLKYTLVSAMETICSFDGLPILKKSAIFLLHNNSLHLSACLNLNPATLTEKVTVDLGQCLCGTAAANGEVSVITSCNSPCHCFASGAKSQEHGHIILPIKAGTEVLGVLLLYTVPGAKISDRVLRLLRAISRQITVSISNQQHFDHVNNLSLHDPLTGLANRRKMHVYLEEQIDIAKRYHKQLAVIMIDIDFFKKYNDTYGHEEGDKILAQVGAILASQVRDSDLAVRFGGEEFVLIMPETGNEPACQPAERIRKAIERETPVTISLGVACFQKDCQPENLIAMADKALYMAKEKGRNRLVKACNCNHDNLIKCM